MIRAVLIFTMMVAALFAYNQAIPISVEERWKSMNKSTEYRRNNSLDWQKRHSLTIPEMGEEAPYIVDPYVNWYENDWEKDDLVSAREQRLVEQSGNTNGLIRRKTKQNTRNIQELDPDYKPRQRKQINLDDNTEPWSGWSTILIIIALVIFGVLFYHLFIKKIETENKVYANNDLTANNLQLHEIPKDEIESKLEQAVADKNYRLAIRLHYLMLLKLLHEGGWISWKMEKTNQHYISELREATFRYDFRKCVYYFDQVWYGKKILHDSHFPEIANQFEQLTKSVKKHAS